MKTELVQIEAAEIFRSLTMEACVPLMADTLKNLSAGGTFQPPRSVHVLPGGGLFGFMPAYLGPDDYFGAKVVTGFHSNQGTEYPSHMGSVLLFDSKYGALRAMAEAGAVTQIRTGAVSGAATGLLARRDASSLALIGAGAQARSHLAAMCLVRPIKRVTVWDYYPQAAEALAKEIRETRGLEASACLTVEDTAKDADIVCTVSLCKEPVLYARHVKPGAHINAVGAFTPTTREVASDLVAASKLYADSREAMLRECGEYLVPKAEGLLNDSHIRGEIGEILLGRCPGRENDSEITLFDALGLASEDVACAKYVYLKKLGRL
ncbi:ornithine cyclodeaminase family protein [Papillibacter cinnamivorans]|uniref:Ornithine cyclodeaminase n=1 Tax=Papillibacter cinnamivorans DSM 12816 TaxID=1122930 RepID=A0A1W1ZCY4_9FIRM|nr:ornithine cyclodeaminase family protein [Papillibacter cinnamivorans]SMC46273.1 ornithine cyclodeaminase [Papillibacter cinnamivorans DSM 12816]